MLEAAAAGTEPSAGESPLIAAKEPKWCSACPYFLIRLNDDVIQFIMTALKCLTMFLL